MPKETIQDVSGMFDVKVGWRPDGDVQIGIEEAAGFSLVSKLYGDPEALRAIASELVSRLDTSTLDHDVRTDEQKDAALEQIGRLVLDVVEGSQTSPGETSYTGVWSNLTRHSANKLIRVIRRARDQAWGADA